MIKSDSRTFNLALDSNHSTHVWYSPIKVDVFPADTRSLGRQTRVVSFVRYQGKTEFNHLWIAQNQRFTGSPKPKSKRKIVRASRQLLSKRVRSPTILVVLKESDASWQLVILHENLI